MCVFSRCYYTSSLRFYNDPVTIIPGYHNAYSATSLRLSRSFYVHQVLTTWPDHDLTALSIYASTTTWFRHDRTAWFGDVQSLQRSSRSWRPHHDRTTTSLRYARSHYDRQHFHFFSQIVVRSGSRGTAILNVMVKAIFQLSIAE